MVDVFDQVEEELRSDRYKRLARTWLPVVGAVLLIALVAALAWWGWDSWQTSRADKASIAYDRGMQSLQANNPVGADAAFTQAAKEGNGAYKAMAMMQRAGIAVDRNQIPQAVELFDEAAKATRDPILVDSAKLRAAYLLMDTASLEDVQARLEPLAKDKRPLAAFAQEALALAQLQHGQTAQAREAFVVLRSGLDTPEIVSQRADVAVRSIDAGTAANIKNIVGAWPAEQPASAAPAAQAAPAAPAAAQ